MYSSTPDQPRNPDPPRYSRAERPVVPFEREAVRIHGWELGSIDEGALRYAVGGPAVMSAQLDRYSLVRDTKDYGEGHIHRFPAARFTALWIGGHTDHPLGPSPYKHGIPLCAAGAFAAVITALFVLGHGVGASVDQRRSRRQATL